MFEGRELQELRKLDVTFVTVESELPELAGLSNKQDASSGSGPGRGG